MIYFVAKIDPLVWFQSSLSFVIELDFDKARGLSSQVSQDAEL